MNILKSVKRYRNVYKNWLMVIYGVFRKKQNIVVKFRDSDETYTLDNYAAWLLSTECVDFNVKDSPDLTIVALNFRNNSVKLKFREGGENGLNGDIMGVFVNEEYKWLKAENEVIVDIGANIGDSAIYFALSNARKVIALEPSPYSYKLARENIKMNDLNEKIVLLNAGYGKEGKIHVDSKEMTAGNDIVNVVDGIEIPIYSLKNLIEIHKVNDAVLKLDCEGCEYSIVDEDNDTLRKFKQIQIEYHYGYGPILDKLEEAGFQVNYTEPKKFLNKGASNPHMVCGFIYAERTTSDKVYHSK